MRDRFSESDVADDLFGLIESNILDRAMEDVADMIVLNWPQFFAGQQIRILILRAQNSAGSQIVFDLRQHGFGYWNQAVFF